LSKLALAQDPFFSQYSVSPMTLNPALVGSHMQAENKFSFISRNQWWGSGAQSYLTNSMGYEGHILSNLTNKYNRLSLGLMMLNENSNGGILSNNYFSAALSNQTQLTEKIILKMAISGTYSNRMLNLSNSTFQSQFGSFGFINTASNYDPVAATSPSYIEMNTGLALAYTSTTIDYEFGAAIFHASKPKLGFYDNTKYEIDPRGVAHGSLTIRPNKNGAFTFSGNWQVQAKKQLYTIGGEYTFNVGDSANHQLSIGIWNRINESIYPFASLRVNSFVIGLSYDVITAKNKTSFSSLNSSEASIAWEFGKLKKK